MCLVVLAWESSERYPLIFAANRDERHERPTLAARWWLDHPQVFGGRDLVAHGGWLAVDRAGRLAAVTNMRDAEQKPAVRSRGDLVAEYLAGSDSIDAFLDRVGARSSEYGPFSLLVFDRTDLQYRSNRAPAARLERGIHALSNAPLGIEWPKTLTARNGMQSLLDLDDPTLALFDLLAQRTPQATGDARYRSSLFIDGPVYGTRSSTVILLSADGELTFTERSFDPGGTLTREISERIEWPA
ncbi:MAG TPA: NRDE family protein [Gammaproteobacteria bacterium]|nr:NRDE family protein [Gammaproteobacteria bacterium]